MSIRKIYSFLKRKKEVSKEQPEMEQSMLPDIPISIPPPDIPALLYELNYVNSRNMELQNKKRQNAYKALSKLGPGAKSARLELYKLSFERVEEKDIALKTLESIDANWKVDKRLLPEIFKYLISKLKSENAKDVKKAGTEFLISFNEGDYTLEYLIDQFEKSTSYLLKFNLISVLLRFNKNEKIIIAFKNTLVDSQNVILCNQLLDALEELNFEFDTDFLFFLIETNNDIDIKLKSLKLLKGFTLQEIEILKLIPFLADDDQRIIKLTIDLYSQKPSEAIKIIMERVIELKGYAFPKNDFNKLLESIMLQRSGNQNLMKFIEYDDYLNNLFHDKLNMYKLVSKGLLLLESCLQIHYNSNYQINPDMKKNLGEIKRLYKRNNRIMDQCDKLLLKADQ